MSSMQAQVTPGPEPPRKPVPDGPLVKGENAIQVYCPKCDHSLLVRKGGSKACDVCKYTRTVKEMD